MPDGYDSSKTYPMMTFIGDATTVGKGAAYSLTQGYGGIVWASDYDQAIHPSFVLVPTYDSTIIDDNSGTTKSDLLDVTAQAMLDEGRTCNFPSWVTGTVMTANPGKNMEHMASFDPAYKVDAVRSWIYKQSR